jgi:hypothetical protein
VDKLGNYVLGDAPRMLVEALGDIAALLATKRLSGTVQPQFNYLNRLLQNCNSSACLTFQPIDNNA